MKTKPLLFFCFVATLFMLGCTPSSPSVKIDGKGKVTRSDGHFVISGLDSNNVAGEGKTIQSDLIKVTFTSSLAASGGIGIIVLEDTSAAPPDFNELIKVATISSADISIESSLGGQILISKGETVQVILEQASCSPLYLKITGAGAKEMTEVWAQMGCVHNP